MANPQIITLIALSVASLTAVVGITAFVLAWRSRAEARRTLAVAIQLESELSQLSGDLDTASQRTNDYARRVAWLESRTSLANAMAAAAAAGMETTSSPADLTPAKPSITERRHRVLSLARRGLDTNSISTTLGVPHGEVDLIIGLSQVA
ncbi:MAG TPA: hypothetical protein VM870_09370 [Pyrinomonadaceae bacterium]|nr:hypothetical protein [Pyrinomonadaceae bacterium]